MKMTVMPRNSQEERNKMSIGTMALTRTNRGALNSQRNRTLLKEQRFLQGTATSMKKGGKRRTFETRKDRKSVRNVNRNRNRNYSLNRNRNHK
mmetsp:Transcript_3057/g.6148  ORF Transcript_3057/g.6148 Transcript_3057/m.6148 type:complete len:93 (+) Transcript_3057:683-961(+)